MPAGAHEYEDVENYPQKDWEEGEFCAVCHNGGEFVGCDRCPRVYHLECYIPELTAEPADGWICLLCRTKKEFEKLSNDNVRLGGNMAKRDRQVCVRLLFEVYNVYPESISFKLVKNLDFHQYRTVINKPIALDVIKSKLDIDHTDAYMSVADFVSDVRLMFQNCRTFWKTFTGGDIYIEHATNLWKHFEELWKDWKVLTSHASAPAFIIAPYEKKKAVSHNNFPKEREGRGGRGRKPAGGRPPAGRPFREEPRGRPGPASKGRPSSKDPLSMSSKNKGRTRDDSSEDEAYSRKKSKNDYNNNTDEDSKRHVKSKKKRKDSEDESEDDYDPRDDEGDGRKKKIKAEKFSPPSSKSYKDKKMKREKDSEDEDSDEDRKDIKRPGPISSKGRPNMKKRDSEDESDSEDSKPRKSDKAHKKSKRETASSDYEDFQSPEFADLPMN